MGDDETFELVLPFVACRSEGGPHDDDSFVAGFTVGKAWGALAAGQPFSQPVRADIVAQLDLVAMHFGAHLTSSELDGVHVWVTILPRLLLVETGGAAADLVRELDPDQIRAAVAERLTSMDDDVYELTRDVVAELLDGDQP